MRKPPEEKSSFRIVNGDAAISFTVHGSVVSAIKEAFSWLSPERRLKLLERLHAAQTELLAKEAERAKAEAPQGSEG